MAKKRKTLPKEMRALLESGDITAAKEQFLRCEPNAVTGKYGSNIFSLSPLPREFAMQYCNTKIICHIHVSTQIN